MSLRIFHVIFIVASVLLSLFVGIWGVREFIVSRSGANLAVGVVCLACAAALVLYGRLAFRKLRELP